MFCSHFRNGKRHVKFQRKDHAARKVPAQDDIECCRAAAARRRAAFLAAVAVYLRTMIGDGELGRAIRELQKEHYRNPTPPEGACAFDLAWHTGKTGRAR